MEKHSTINFEILYDTLKTENKIEEQNWEQIRFLINGIDILNDFRIDKQFHYGIDSSLFLAQEGELLQGSILLGICSCRTAGDSDIMANIHSFDEIVIWDIYNTNEPSEFDTFTFNKKQYKKSIEEIKNKFVHKIEDAYKWAWMLDFSKNEMEIEENKTLFVIKHKGKKIKNLKFSSLTFKVGYGRLGPLINDTSNEWEEVFPEISKKDIIYEFKIEKQNRLGIDSSLFLAQEKYLFNGNIILGICGCKDTGCSDLLVNIHSIDEFIMWDIYVSWCPSKFETYFFHKNEYESAIFEIKKSIKHRLNEAYKWTWMLKSSKSELQREIVNIVKEE